MDEKLKDVQSKLRNDFWHIFLFLKINQLSHSKWKTHWLKQIGPLGIMIRSCLKPIWVLYNLVVGLKKPRSHFVLTSIRMWLKRFKRMYEIEFFLFFFFAKACGLFGIISWTVSFPDMAHFMTNWWFLDFYPTPPPPPHFYTFFPGSSWSHSLAFHLNFGGPR